MSKFTEGAWVVVVLVPLMYFALIRLHRQYVDEEHQLEEGAAEAAEAPVLNRHTVIVLVDRLDMATARALQYAAHPAPRRAPGRPLRHRPPGVGRRSKRSGAGSG